MDLESDYAAAGFRGRLGFGERSALLVVDVCQAYLDPASPLHAGVDEPVAVVAALVEAARAAGVDVLWTRVVPRSESVFARKVPSLALFAGPLGDFPGECAPLPGEAVISKHGASSFFGTDLADQLRARGVDTVVVCGLSTSGCVRATAVDAVQHDLVPVVVRDACGDRDPRPHEAALFDLDSKYADVVDSADVLRHWSAL